MKHFSDDNIALYFEYFVFKFNRLLAKNHVAFIGREFPTKIQSEAREADVAVFWIILLNNVNFLCFNWLNDKIE